MTPSPAATRWHQYYSSPARARLGLKPPDPGKKPKNDSPPELPGHTEHGAPGLGVPGPERPWNSRQGTAERHQAPSEVPPERSGSAPCSSSPPPPPLPSPPLPSTRPLQSLLHSPPSFPLPLSPSSPPRCRLPSLLSSLLPPLLKSARRRGPAGYFLQRLRGVRCSPRPERPEPAPPAACRPQSAAHPGLPDIPRRAPAAAPAP